MLMPESPSAAHNLGRASLSHFGWRVKREVMPQSSAKPLLQGYEGFARKAILIVRSFEEC